MPTAEVILPGRFVYQPSQAPSDLNALELAWSKLLASHEGYPATSSTLATRDGETATFRSGASNMAEQSFSQSDFRSANHSGQTLEETLFDAKAMTKVLTSRVSMYLREGWRDKLFYQLDNLMDPVEWNPEDKPLQEQSFDTFLKAICDLQPAKRPGLGLAYTGNLIAVWRVNEHERISLEFTPTGCVTLIGSRCIDEEPVSFSARPSVKALKKTLVSLNCAEWLGCV